MDSRCCLCSSPTAPVPSLAVAAHDRDRHLLVEGHIYQGKRSSTVSGTLMLVYAGTANAGIPCRCLPLRAGCPLEVPVTAAVTAAVTVAVAAVAGCLFYPCLTILYGNACGGVSPL